MGPGLEALRGIEPALRTPRPLPLAASCALLVLGYLVSGAIWGRIVADLGGPRLAPLPAARIFMIANLGRYVPGKVWQIAGLAALARGRGVSAGTATAAAVVGQLLALLAAAAIGLGALLAAGSEARRWGVVGVVVLAVGVAACLLPPVFSRLSTLGLRALGRAGTSRPGSGRVLAWLGWYTANWALYALSFWVLARSLGMEAPVWSVAPAFAAAYALGYLAVFAPAGLGVREGFLVALLTPHLGAAPSGALAVVARLWTTAVEIVPAAAFWIHHLASVRPPDAPAEGAGE